MLNFDRDRYLSIQSGALGIAGDMRSLVGELLSSGIERVFFMGTGGVQLLTQPAIELAARYSTFPISGQMPAQVVVAPPAGLNERALVVLPSLSGTTKESVELLSYLKSVGARTLSLTGHENTPLAQDADYNFTNFAEDDTSSEMFYLQSLLLVLSILDERGEIGNYNEIVAELQRLPELLADAKAAFEDEAATLAETIKDENYHIFTGAGSTWPAAHYYGMCILEEMQWIRTRPVHASDFFHGTLELVEPGVSVFLLKGEDPYRALAERVEKFAPRYTDRLRVIDTAKIDLPGISTSVRAMISPVVLASLLERLSAHLEVLREHPLTTRRYYKRVEY